MFSVKFLHTLVYRKYNFYDTAHLPLWTGSPKTSDSQIQKPISYHMNRNSAQFNATHKKQEMQVVYKILRPKTKAVIGTKVDDYRP
jgi:hypothetical protein